MKSIKLCLVLGLGFGSLTARAQSDIEDQQMYRLESPEIFEIQQPELMIEDLATTGDPATRLSNCTDADRNAQPNAVDIGTVLKVGQVAWQIIEKNQPVIDVTPNSANALPKGVRCWQDLEGWQRPRQNFLA